MKIRDVTSQVLTDHHLASDVADTSTGKGHQAHPSVLWKDAVLSAVPEGNRDCQEQDSAAGIPTFLVVGQPEGGLRRARSAHLGPEVSRHSARRSGAMYYMRERASPCGNRMWC